MSRFFLLCLTFTIMLTTNSYSQDPPIEWEEIPITDIQMTTFPDDSNATAVILCDYGVTKVNNDFNLEYSRHLRVKILNENGYDWGTHTIYIYKGRNGERLEDLEAITYSLDENGEIIETELDDDNIFEEELTEDRYKYSFTMPALKPGCIVDILYTIEAKSLWYVRGWTFQRDEPVLWSEYRLIYPRNISFAIVNMGYEPWEIKDYKVSKEYFSGFAASILGEFADCSYYRWAVKNAPALRDEPYITTIDDYTNRLDIQLAGYSFVSTGFRQFLTDWKTLVNELVDHKNFMEKIDPDDVEVLTTTIIKGLTSPEKKIKAIYNWITKSIVWTGEKRVFADYDVDEVIKYKKGNSAEITFLLLSMLQSAGINGDPVILSTRSNGKIQELYPIVSQFNYVLARVNIGTKTFFIDATNPLRPLDILPVYILGVKGLVVKEDKPEWIALKCQQSNIDKSLTAVTLQEDGSLSAKFEELYGEYKSLSLRTQMSGKEDIDYGKELFDTESSGFTIDSVNVEEKDSINLPLKIMAKITSTSYSQVGGNFIYFNPNMIHKMTDNPFKAKVRKFPIDYAYPRGKIVIINIILPVGYELKEKYDNKNITLGKSAYYTRIMQASKNIIQIMTRMEIRDSEIKSTYYQQLKDFYAQVIEAQSEMLVFGPVEKSKEVTGTNE